MKKLSFVFALFLLTALFYECRKDVSYIGGPDSGSAVLPDPLTTSVQGNVVDENEQPAAGVSITAGTSTATTDANGYFHISKATLDKNTTLVTAQKDGYFKSYRVFAATSGCNQVVIKLVKRNFIKSLPASQGGDATLSNGAIVHLPANGVVVAASGAAYSGDINVYAAYINPNAADIAKTVPGSFAANDKGGKRVILSSFGMLAVELQSASGEKLQVKSGSIAKLTIPVSSSPSSAPQTISLWYVDETTGIWQEEGSATKQGSNYVGDVKHFSFWNCDYANNAVTLSLILQTPDGLPLVNATVMVTKEKTGSDTSVAGETAYGYTDSLGQVKGLVPANKNLKMQVLGPCGAVVYSQAIAPLSQDKDLGVINVNSGTSLLTFTGTLVNCNNAPVTNGFAIVTLEYNTRYIATDKNGQFKTTYVSCSTFPSTISVLGIDNDAQQQSAATTINVTTPLTNAGNISVCGISSQQYINYTYDGKAYNITSANSDSLTGYTQPDPLGGVTYVWGFSLPDSLKYLQFTIENGAVGTFPASYFVVQKHQSITFAQPTITFTKFATTQGDFYEGSIAGTFAVDSTSGQHTISGSFKIRKNN